MPSLLDTLRAQFLEAQDNLRAIETAAADEGREPNEAESANMATLAATLETLNPRIAAAAATQRSIAATADLLAGVPSDTTARVDSIRQRPAANQFRSLGEFAQAAALGTLERPVKDDFLRALVDIVTGDVPGLVPPAWMSDLVKTVQTARPFITAFDTRPLPPSGMTVQYPTITQRPLVGPQVVEKSDVVSRKTLVTAAVADVKTYGGGEDVSIQVLQRTDPSYLSLMLDLYAEEMAAYEDGAAIAAAKLALPAANKDTLYLGTDPALFNSVLVSAAKIVLANRGVVDTMVAGLDVWAAFAGAVDSEGRPLFPDVAPSNPVGRVAITGANGEVRGLNFVVDPNMIATEAYVGWSQAFTSLLGGLQTLTADVPAKLGRDFATFEFVAFAPRRPDCIVQVNAGADPTP